MIDNDKHLKRLLFLDLLKFISISYIFIYHFIYDMDDVHHFINLDFIKKVFFRPNFNFGIIACALFIMISGATLSISINKQNDFAFNLKSFFLFYKKRVLRILLPYYVVYILFYIYLVFYNKVLILFPNVSPVSYLWNIFGMDGYASILGYDVAYLNVGEWFLGCIIICYLFFPLLYVLNKKYKLQTFILMNVYLVSLFLNSDYRNATNLNVRAYYQIYNFYIGILLSDLKIIKKINFRFSFLFIVIIAFFYLYKWALSFPFVIIQSIISLMLFISFYYLEDYLQNSNIIKLILLKFSVISYEVFLVHHFVISQTNYMLSVKSITKIIAVHLFFNDILWILFLSVCIHYLISVFKSKYIFLLKK